MKKIILSILLFLFCSTAYATTYYAPTVGVSSWSTAVWATSSDQATGSSGPPTSSDTVILDGYAGNVTCSTATCATGTYTETGGSSNYIGTLTVSSGDTLTVSGNVTLSSSATHSGTGTLKFGASSTYISNGDTWPGGWSQGAFTLTIAESETVSGTFTTTGTSVVNGTSLNLNIGGGIALGGNISGTATLVMNGTGTLSGLDTISNNFTINTAGTITLNNTAGNWAYSTGTFTYTSGTIINTGNNLQLNTCTMNAGGMTFGSVSITGSPTITLLSNFNTGTLRNNLSGTDSSVTFTGAYNVTVGTLQWDGNSANNFILPAGQTLNVTNTFQAFPHGNTATFKSGTSSSPMYINYTGTVSNEQIVGTAFTDVTATGTTLYNYAGSTLTRTVNIDNISSSNLCIGTVTATGGVSVR